MRIRSLRWLVLLVLLASYAVAQGGQVGVGPRPASPASARMQQVGISGLPIQHPIHGG